MGQDIERLLGAEEKEFAIFATPGADASYHVAVYPELAGWSGETRVSGRRMLELLRSGAGKIEAALEGCGVFVHSLAEDDVRWLIAGDWVGSRRLRV